MTTQLHTLGVLWKVEIDFDYTAPEADTGVREAILVEDLWLLGYYPEGYGRKNDYVPCRVRADFDSITDAEYAMLEQEVWAFIKACAREEFDDYHGYED
jgi:hypothetical protein